MVTPEWGDESGKLVLLGGSARSHYWHRVCWPLTVEQVCRPPLELGVVLSAHSLRGLRSTQILTAPDFLGTTTIPAHHAAGLFTLEMTPSAKLLFDFGMEKYWDIAGHIGSAFSLSLIRYSSPISPRPLKTL